MSVIWLLDLVKNNFAENDEANLIAITWAHLHDLYQGVLIGFRASVRKFLLNQLDIEWSNNNQCSFQVKMFCLGLRASLIPIVGSHGQAKCKDSWLKI